MKKILFSSLAVLFLPAALHAETDRTKDKTDSTQNLDTIVVTASSGALSEFDTPESVTIKSGDELRKATPAINLSEKLKDIPGLQVRNRQNYAQDLQMAIRGFGASAKYGVRGIRIYVDGIPATMPDGQSQTSNIDIDTIDNVTILRGPFSALYGNSAGGVINIETETAVNQPNKIETSHYYGSYGTWKSGVKAVGKTGTGNQAGDMTYTLSTSRFSTHGFREHSAADKDIANAKLGFIIDNTSKLTLILNSVDLDANDPGSLNYSSWQENPSQARDAVKSYNTRKYVNQTQFGLRYEKELTDNDSLSFTGYAGERKMRSYLAIPYSTQENNPLHAGGAIILKRDYQGIDSRWTHQGYLSDIPMTVTTGIDYETMTERRRGFENYTESDGNYTTGVLGSLRRNERNLMWNIDPYIQSSLSLTDKLRLDLGLRYSSVYFDSNDYYITDDNGDDSGDTSTHKLLPVASLQYYLTPDWNVYTSIGKGFQSPTITELSYRSDGTGGLNLNLKPTTNTSLEIGTKKYFGQDLLSLALFQINTKDEIVVDQSSNGRTTYKNAGKTRRQGIEASYQHEFAPDWKLQLSWTLMDAKYRSDECSTSDCSSDTSIRSGNKLTGIADNIGNLSFGFLPESGWYAQTNIQYVGEVQVNDANTDHAPAYSVTDFSGGYKYDFKDWQLDIYGRVNNVFDRNYIGSIVANDSYSRYYEPAPGRNYGVGLNMSYKY
ncbi:TonB-dependent receptor [Vibrio viridaestus]|uniref:TonB-dependent receptor n=1 Tax=Vibrio viridaestus TaxID=2487322 RepID=A0A3N9TG09_9VIBR|nr:TonB-dependent receptor [Vibrio viridaestus]RQW63197.1 TonB-dependent receptor [Vibrio viridaestus]